MVGFEIKSTVKRRPVQEGRLSLYLSRRGRLVGGGTGRLGFMEKAILNGMVTKAVGFAGVVVFDPGKPDGTPRKLLDVSKLSGMGWRPQVELEDGVGMAYRDFLARNCA
jgi:nucleoside-diphosphate-sugar epimerase